MRRCLAAITLAVTIPLSAAIAPTVAGATVPSTATDASDAITTAKPLVDKFFTLVQKKDVAGLKKFLSPAFELQRADGTGANRSEYLGALPTVESFTLTNFSASRTGSVLVVRYLADATGLVNGKPYAPGPAPRLSVFARTGGKWQIVAHANFNPLTG
jgi:Domain of unknown function (DUF4440)